MNIIEFLLQRIAEDEAVAKRAAFGWGADWESTAPDDAEWSVVKAEGKSEMLGCEDVDVINHIARHDPARVLRECAAKRAIMDIHSDRDGDCARCSDYAWFAILDGGEHEEFPCPTIRHLAAVYRDHPDYQPEWANPTVNG